MIMNYPYTDQPIFKLFLGIFEEEKTKYQDSIDNFFDDFLEGKLEKSFYVKLINVLYPRANFHLLDVIELIWLIINWYELQKNRCTINALLSYCLQVTDPKVPLNRHREVARARAETTYEVNYSEELFFNRKVTLERYINSSYSPCSVIFATYPTLPTALPTILGLGDPPGTQYWLGIRSDYYLDYRIYQKIKLGANYFGNPQKLASIVQYPIILHRNLRLNQNLILFDYSEIDEDGKRKIYNTPHVIS